jgi:hypothetical protein
VAAPAPGTPELVAAPALRTTGLVVALTLRTAIAGHGVVDRAALRRCGEQGIERQKQDGR